MAEVTYFERLDTPECLWLLRGGGVGRVAWQDGDGLSVLPVNYRIVGSSVVFQTNIASTLTRLAEPTRVASQVDEVDYATAVGWSVLVRGTNGVRDTGDVTSSLPRNPAVGVAVKIEEVAGRVISGNPVPWSWGGRHGGP